VRISDTAVFVKTQGAPPPPEPDPPIKPPTKPKNYEKGKIVKKDKKEKVAGKKKKKVSLCRFDCRLCRCGVLLNVVLYSRYLWTITTSMNMGLF